MADARGGPQVYSIAAHRGFADALVAGLVPRYGDGELGLARLTLLLPPLKGGRSPGLGPSLRKLGSPNHGAAKDGHVVKERAEEEAPAAAAGSRRRMRMGAHVDP